MRNDELKKQLGFPFVIHRSSFLIHRSSVMPETWLEACPLAELPLGGRKLVKVESVDIALFNLAGTIYAIKNRCPHRSGPLIRGFVDPTGGIKCPMHGWRFDLRDGSSERPAQATTYRTKIENGSIYLAFSISHPD